MAFPAFGNKGGAGMHDPVIVEHDAFPGVQAKPHEKAFVLQQFSKAAEGRVIAVEKALIVVEDIGHVLADSDAGNVALVIEFDHPLTCAHVIAVVFVVKGHGRFAQQAEIVRVRPAKFGRDRSAVDEEAFPAFDRIATAMQELDAGRQVFGRDIGVQFQCLGCIGQIVGIDVEANVEIEPEKGGAGNPIRLAVWGSASSLSGTPVTIAMPSVSKAWTQFFKAARSERIASNAKRAMAG
jgi:hypothetical protein